MVSRTNLNLHPAEQGRCNSLHPFAPEGEPFFDTKSKCGSNSGAKVPATRINTGVSAGFRLPKKLGQHSDSQVQKWGVLGLRKSTPPATHFASHYCTRTCSGARPSQAI